jgi:hypothetical protein
LARTLFTVAALISTHRGDSNQGEEARLHKVETGHSTGTTGNNLRSPVLTPSDKRAVRQLSQQLVEQIDTFVAIGLKTFHTVF